MNNITYKKEKNGGIQVGVDLTFIEPRLINISSVLTARYDAGICKHRLERTGVMVIETNETTEQYSDWKISNAV